MEKNLFVMYISIQKARPVISKLVYGTPCPIVIMGLYGTKRKEIVNELVDILPDVKKVIDHCTREKAPHEIHGVHHYFYEEQAFQAADLIEPTVHTIYKGYKTGFSLAETRQLAESKKQGLFVISSAKSLEALHELYEGRLCIVRVVASYEYRYANIYKKYIDTPNGYEKVQHIMSFSNQQDEEFENPFLLRLVHCTVSSRQDITPALTAATIAQHLHIAGFVRTAAVA